MYFSLTIPDKTECLLGFLSIPNAEVINIDDDGNIIDEETINIFSIGLIFLRIDIKI